MPTVIGSQVQVQTPFGLVRYQNSAQGEIVKTQNGSFDITSTKVSPHDPTLGVTKDSLSTGKPGILEQLQPSFSKFQGPLTKVMLMPVERGTGLQPYVFQFNPEKVTIPYPTQIGEYSGVSLVPQVFFQGKKIARIPIRFFVQDRVDGVNKYLFPLQDYAAPNGSAHTDSGTAAFFKGPPLCRLVYGQLGTYLGYVEAPNLEVEIQGKDLTPLQGFLTFTFVVVRAERVATSVPSVLISGPDSAKSGRVA